ncbi:hypothetical protein [Pseudonocardia broussonetiae]|uniref:Tail terminator n=1 Tax=Pseudonocardia broussonetiae TaxID=2736640 RepID=A0A6M6JXL0_9PSEU|nr:hypothetical protein [Pseudonocardia broussonetiae]QJY51252.1 hypothetical protein HOP40_35315 [Pseudonocardia broussonetiae]
MDDLAAALDTIDDLRVFPYWADRISPPAAVVAWPDPLTYDSTMARGSDQAEIPVIVMVGKVDTRTARDTLAVYADGSGASSVKARIEAHTPTAYDSARVDRCEFGVITVAGVEYLAATFYIDIIGSGG